MKYDWDENKNLANLLKHGIDFTDVYRVFDGPMIVRVDDREDYGEIRWRGIGYLVNNVIIVVYVEIDEDTIRVISARKALKHERRKFEQELRYRLG